MAGPQGWLSAEEVAVRVGVSRQRIYQLLGEGKMPAGKFVRNRRGLVWHPRTIDRWAQIRKITPGPVPANRPTSLQSKRMSRIKEG